MNWDHRECDGGSARLPVGQCELDGGRRVADHVRRPNCVRVANAKRGVRLELEMIYRLRRRDGTVLMLSPLEHVIRRNPGRFEIRPRHGPLRKRRSRELTE
jgi:hypothetical protein